jgi:exoribonuclease R
VIRGADLEVALRALRSELAIPSRFPADVVAEATAAASAWTRDDRLDATDVDFVTLDPAGSRDLDQAFAIEPTSGGHRLRYAIADVGAFVQPDGPMAAEADKRGETLYLPDGRAPLYPPELSEGAASLLPDQDRPAVLWTLDLDGNGELTMTDVRRAVVRSRAQLDYASIEQTRPQVVTVLRTIGEQRKALEVHRGGVSLNVPEQEVSNEAGTWTLAYRTPAPVEDWNAQLSLLTGMAAAALMIEAKVGLLRVMPKPSHHTITALRRSAVALDVDWPGGASYADVIRSLDPAVPSNAAMLRLAGAVFRGARYVAFDGKLPEETVHAAVAAPYAHATAPLRRLADRFVSEVCLAACAGSPVPAWAHDGLARLPHAMGVADQHAHQVDHAVVDLAETVLLQNRVGETFQGVVVDADEGRGQVQLADPPVRATLTGDNLPLGQQVAVRLDVASVANRQLAFALAGERRRP